MKSKIMGIAVVGLLAGLMSATAWSQDFQKGYSLASGGTISIANVSGEISVTGYNGSALVVSAVREGRDKDLVEIVDQSTSEKVSLKVQYPRGDGNYSASVRFFVQVPLGANYNFDSLAIASGNIHVENVAGDINAKTASGDIRISQVEGKVRAATASGDIEILAAAGAVTASTVNGDLDVELNRIDSGSDLKLSSVSGNVTLKAPAQLNAEVDMSTLSGSIESAFPIAVEEGKGPGKKASGILGNGSVRLKMSTISGNLRLLM